MAPTYRSSDLLLARPMGRASAVLPRGAVAIFRRNGLSTIKRAVGVPGDTVELEAGRLFVNGVSVDGRARIRGALTVTWHVPEAHYFMAGDNAAVSDDSRTWLEPFVAADGIDATVSKRVVRLAREQRVTPRRRSPAAALAE